MEGVHKVQDVHLAHHDSAGCSGYIDTIGDIRLQQASELDQRLGSAWSSSVSVGSDAFSACLLDWSANQILRCREGKKERLMALFAAIPK